MTLHHQLRSKIRDVPDFPKPGILFRDITPVLEDPKLFGDLVRALADPWRKDGLTRVVGVESRGFIFGAPLALELGVGFSLVRKPGKLPHKTLTRSYSLEYGEGSLEMHAGTVGKKDRAIIVDDLLATGGTAHASAHLVAETGATVVGYSFVVELGALKGRARLDARVEALLTY